MKRQDSGSSTPGGGGALHSGAGSGIPLAWPGGPSHALRLRCAAPVPPGDSRLMSVAGMVSSFADTLGTFPGTFLGRSRMVLAFVPGLETASAPLFHKEQAGPAWGWRQPCGAGETAPGVVDELAQRNIFGGFGGAAACPLPGGGVLLPRHLLTSHLRPHAALDARCGVAWGLALACSRGAVPVSGWRHEWIVVSLAFHLCWQWLERALSQPGSGPGAEIRVRLALAQRAGAALAEAAVASGGLCPAPAAEDETDPGWDREIAGLSATDRAAPVHGVGSGTDDDSDIRPLAGVEVVDGDSMCSLGDPWRGMCLASRSCLLFRSLAGVVGSGPARHALRRAVGQGAAAAAATATRQRHGAAVARK